MENRYDLIIIGGGPGGYVVAAEQAAMGRKVMLVEKDHLGGTCLNRGCIPTKALCAAARDLETIRVHAPQMGIKTENISADYSVAHARATEVIAELRQAIADKLKDVTVINGTASLGQDHTVIVDGIEYTANMILIATGSRPALLPVPGAEKALTSDQFLALDTVPATAVVIGAGVIGLELASVMRAYGTEVTVLEYAPEILPAMDKDLAKRLRTALKKRGIKIETKAQVTAVTDNGHTVVWEDKKGSHTASAEMVLMAVGRRAVLPEGLDVAGVDVDSRGFIAVDENMETSVPGIYAVGDCNGRSMLAHAATAQARKALGEEIDLSVMPSVVFTIPECASISSDDEFVEESIGKVRVPYAANGMCVAAGEAEGVLTLSYSENSAAITGVEALGPHAAEFAAMGSILINSVTTVDELASGIILPHPTVSELLSTAAAMAVKNLE